MRSLLAFVLMLPGITSAETLSGNVVSVADGDTLTILTAEKNEIKVRLAAIDAPEKAMPFGQKSKQSLSELCFRKQASVETVDIDRYGRTVAVVTCDGILANDAQVKNGLAWVYRKHSKGFEHLLPLEAAAKASRLGLWSEQNPTPPWMWRKAQR